MVLYPINIAISGWPVIVVGGGTVAARKVASLLECGALVTVISPDICEELDLYRSNGSIELVSREYHPGDLEGGRLVFAATNQPDVQQAVWCEAKEKAIPVNIVDSPAESTFHVPASLRRGDLLMSVSTGGGSPLLSAKIRKELEKTYGEEYDLLVKLLAALRECLHSYGYTGSRLKNVFEKLLSLNILAHIQTNSWEKIQKILDDELPSGLECDRVVAEIKERMKTGGS